MTVAQIGRFAVEVKVEGLDDDATRWRPMSHDQETFELARQEIDRLARIPGVVAVAIRQLEP